MKIKILIGEQNTYKSSIARALTGVRDMKTFDVGTRKGIIKVYVDPTSLQEKGISPQEAVKVILEKQREEATEVLLCLRINAYNGCPGYRDYIDLFIQKGFVINSLVFLYAPTLIYSNNEPHIYLPINNKEPSNVFASQLRQKWNWL